jgi:hypothetical protein
MSGMGGTLGGGSQYGPNQELMKDIVGLGSAAGPGPIGSEASGADPVLGQIKSAGNAADASFNAATKQVVAGFNHSQAASATQASHAQSDFTKTDAASVQSTAKRSTLVESYFSFSETISRSLQGMSTIVDAQITTSWTSMIQGMVEGNFSLTQSLKSLGKGVASSYLSTIASGLMAHGAKSTTDGAALAAKGLPGSAKAMSMGAEMMGSAVAMKKLSQAYLAQGGVVSKPTLAMIGEGGQSEAVIPLDKLPGGQALTKVKQVSQISMTFNGVRNLADISNGKLRTQATAYFQSALGTRKS